jgi:hypothetical protein
MMKRETLEDWRRVVSKFDRYTTVEPQRQLIDSHLEALDEIDRLNRELAKAEESPMHPLDYEGEDFV